MTQTALPSSRNDTTSGLAMMTVAMIVVPVIDAIAKHLSAEIPPLEIACLRFVVGSALLVPLVVWRGGWRILRQPHLGLHFLRGAGIAGATAFFFAAVAFMPLAEVAAIFFVEPLILTLLSALVFGERIGWRRIAAVLVGFCGAMLIIRPSFAEFGWSALLPLGAAVSFSIYMIITRRLAGDSDPWTLQALANVSGAVTLGAVFLAFGERFVLPDAAQASLVLTIGLIAILCHTLIIFALRRVTTGVIAPFQYLEIIGATFWGFMFFGDFPDALTWLGIAIIVGSGIFVFYRERMVSDA